MPKNFSPATDKARKVLAVLAPGEYSVADIYKHLLQHEVISFGCSWSRIRNWLQTTPNIEWNGVKVPARNSRWVKTVPVTPKVEPLVVLPRGKERLQPVETSRGPISTHLARIDSMMEALCHSLDLKVDMPQNDSSCREALLVLQKDFTRIKGGYIPVSTVNSFKRLIDATLEG